MRVKSRRHHVIFRLVGLSALAAVLTSTPLTARSEEAALQAAEQTESITAEALPVVTVSPAAIKLASIQREVAMYVTTASESNEKLKNMEERIAALSEELTTLTAERNALLEKDEAYQALLQRQAEAMKEFTQGM